MRRALTIFAVSFFAVFVLAFLALGRTGQSGMSFDIGFSDVVYSALVSALIGAFFFTCVSESMLRQWRPGRRR